MRSRSNGVPAATKVFGSGPKTASRPRGQGIRPSLFYFSFAVLLGTNIFTLVCFLMAPDISALLEGRNKLVSTAYEDRIAQLRVEVDRLHSRQFAQAGDINLQLQELSQQQELLLEQHQLVRQLAQKAADLGIETAQLGDTPAGTVEPPRVEDLAEVSASMGEMMDESRLALAALSEAAGSSTDTILDALGGVGLVPRLPDAPELGVGGPLLAAAEPGEPDSLVDEANDVYLALARFKAARSAIELAPIHKPMLTLPRVSSGFGNRKDPFTGGRALHAGIDYPAPKGTLVLSAGSGVVTFVGQRSGYGNLVEVTHAGGLVTRYGHLSAFLVDEGQVVETGVPIAKVGSTGRSTGPHLHFEVRRKDVALDPGRYLAVGKRLQRFLGA